MTTTPPGLKGLWYRWKALRLPWRKQFLVGADLAGNTFWEFRDALNTNRWRRIVKYTRQIHYADVKISPQWHQWLRHTRDEAPSIQEQQYEVSRRAMMRQLAAEADERWKSVPSFLDAPSKRQPQPAIGVQDPGGHAQQSEPVEKEGARSAVDGDEKVQATVDGRPQDEGRLRGKTREKKHNPWADRRPKGAPGEEWQPEPWTPGVAGRGQ